jgi:predicted GIY-YIG superfamily endonuclease
MLELPADLEVWGGPDRWHDPAVYVLVLDRPADVADAWDALYDSRPAWFDRMRDARAVWYVGASADCLSRLEDHRDGDVRGTVLTELCGVTALRNVWWFDDADRAFEQESALAIQLGNQYGDVYVHQR